jgi:hypothetical protein
MKPLKAINVTAIQYDFSKPPLADHPPYPVKFEDTDGEIKIGFYRPLTDDFNEDQAKNSVAASVAANLTLEGRFAEERLVLDDENKIFGSLWLGTVFSHQMLNATAESFLEKNWVELLIHLWRTNAKTIFQWPLYADMPVSEYEPRAYLNQFGMLKLKSTDLDEFPFINQQDFSLGSLLPFKRFNSSSLYNDEKTKLINTLAANPLLKKADGTICFQEQMFSAILKELLTFDQQSLLSRRLIDYFGNLPCSATNNRRYVDHMRDIFEQEYDELYRTTVFYKGCEKNKVGACVIGFANFLLDKPSTFKNIKEWAILQNKKLVPSWQYDLAKMDQRYHQIWRDAHTFALREMLNALKTIEENLTKEWQNQQQNFSARRTEIWRLLDGSIENNNNQELEKILISLRQLATKLHACTAHYRKIESKELTIESNQQFIKEMNTLIKEYENQLLEVLNQDELRALYWELFEIINKLYNVSQQFDLLHHFSSKDKEWGQTDSKDVYKINYPKETEILTCISELFAWVGKLDPATFKNYVNNLIDMQQKAAENSNLMDWLMQVKEHLHGTKKEMNTYHLATLFLSGNSQQTSLNICLCKGLFALMQQDLTLTFLQRQRGQIVIQYDSQFDVRLHSLIVKFILVDPQFDDFRHCFAALGIFYKTGYLDNTLFTSSLKRLKQLIPSLNGEIVSYEQEHYIAESYRLLTGLAYMGAGQQDNELEAYHCLMIPFKHNSLQEIARLALGQLIYLNPKYKKISHDIRIARYKFILYSFGQALQNPILMKNRSDIQLIAYNCLANLNNKKDTEILPQNFYPFKDKIQFLNYSGVLNLIKQTLEKLVPKDEHNQHEIDLLTRVSHQFKYHSTMVQFLWQSPAFCTTLYQQYPDKTYFLVLENLLPPFVADVHVFDSSINTASMQPVNNELIESLQACELASVSLTLTKSWEEIQQKVNSAIISPNILSSDDNSDYAPSSSRFFVLQHLPSPRETTKANTHCVLLN